MSSFGISSPICRTLFGTRFMVNGEIARVIPEGDRHVLSQHTLLAKVRVISKRLYRELRRVKLAARLLQQPIEDLHEHLPNSVMPIRVRFGRQRSLKSRRIRILGNSSLRQDGI